MFLHRVAVVIKRWDGNTKTKYTPGYYIRTRGGNEPEFVHESVALLYARLIGQVIIPELGDGVSLTDSFVDSVLVPIAYGYI